MRLITWNVARRVTRLPELAAALAGREPDVVCLQEVTARGGPLWTEALGLMGLAHVEHSLATRPHGVLIAAREPLEPCPGLPVPWPDSAVSAAVDGIEVHCVHVPNAANGQIKPDTLTALRAGLAGRTGAGAPQILCGDLNTPRRENPDGSVVSFAFDRYGRLRPERGEPWDSAELGVVPGLADLGFTDCFRALHGYAEREPSWVYPRWRSGYRLDHVFCSGDLQPVAASYHHEWRDARLSDHSAFEVDLTPGRMS
jgi:exodeoxyribonuclease-3